MKQIIQVTNKFTRMNIKIKKVLRLHNIQTVKF